MESDTHYLVPSGADWAAWDDVNGVLSFMSDAMVMENLEYILEDFGREGADEFGTSFRDMPAATAEEAWDVINKVWEGDPGGRGWQQRVPEGATWITVQDRDWSRLPVPEWHFEPPPLDVELTEPGY